MALVFLTIGFIVFGIAISAVAYKTLNIDDENLKLFMMGMETKEKIGQSCTATLKGISDVKKILNSSIPDIHKEEIKKELSNEIS